MSTPTQARKGARVLWGLLALAVACSGLGGYRFYQHTVAIEEGEKRADLAAVAELKVGQIVAWRAERLRDARLFSSGPSGRAILGWLANPGDRDLAASVQTLWRDVAAHSAYSDIAVCTPSGRPVFRLARDRPEIEEQARRLMARAAASRDAAVGELFRCADTKHVHLDFAAPVLDAGGEAKAILLLRSAPERALYPLIERWPMQSATAETLLIRREGDYVLFLNRPRHGRGPALTERIPLTRTDVPAVQAALGRTGVTVGTDYRGRRTVAHLSRVPGSPWLMVAKVDRAEIYANARLRGSLVLGLFGAVIVSLFTLAALLMSLRQAAEHRATLEAERALRESREQFRATFDQAAVGIAHVAPDGRWLRANGKLCDILGYTHEELLKGSFQEIAHPDDLHADVRQVRQMLSGELDTYSVEERYVRKDGHTIWINLTVSLVRDEHGAPDYFVSVIEDITERKADEVALAASRRELDIRNRIAHVFLTNPDDAMYQGVLDVLLDAFDSQYGVFGYIDEEGALVVPTMTRSVWDRCEVAARTWRFPRQDWGESIWPTAIRGKQILHSNEESKLTPPGHVRILRNISAPIVHLGTVIGLFQVANKPTAYDEADLALARTIADVIAPILHARIEHDREQARRRRAEDDLKRRTEDLARSNQDLEQFAYVASHDLQEPLRMVSSFTQLLADRYGDRLDGEAHEYIQFAVDGANRMQALIQGLLTYSRVSTRGGPPEPADAHQALGEAVWLLRAAIQESSAVVTNGELPSVMADGTQLTQVFQNLIGNAVKFRRPDTAPRVHISAERSNDREGYWTFTVKDNGIGIEPKHRERIFVIFRRLHTREEYPGAGIGLALCKRIVERHGGRIWVGETDGPGSAFHFTLPSAELRGDQPE